MGKPGRTAVLILCLGILVAGLTGAVPVQAAELSDIQGHWAEAGIRGALAQGYVGGYPDGTFRPNDQVTRAEFVTMLNRALGLREENTVSMGFADIPAGAWYRSEVARASFARYVTGISDREFAPNQSITRQEAAVMLSRILPQEGHRSTGVLDAFADRERVASWSSTGMAVLVNKGYMHGRAGGYLAPVANLTRAEAVTLLSKILGSETVVRGDTVVETAGEILRDAIYVGDITIARSVGEGDVTLQNLAALSRVFVLGGGANSVLLEDAYVVRLIVLKEGDPARVQAGGNSIVHYTILFNDNILVDERDDGARPNTTNYGEIIRIDGNIDEETARALAAAVESVLRTGGALSVEEVAQQAGLVVEDPAGSTDDRDVIVITIGAPAPPPVPGPPDPPPASGGGGGGAPPVQIDLTDASVAGDPLVGVTLEAEPVPLAATADYQWESAAAPDGAFSEIAGASHAAYEVAPGDLGRYLRVKATGTGQYTGNVTSDVVGPVDRIVVTWPAAEAITYGESLGDSGFLGGSAALETAGTAIPGTFSFDDDTVEPDAGTCDADVTFTPDEDSYPVFSSVVSVTVHKATPTVTTWPVPGSGITYGESLADAGLDVSGAAASVAGTFAYQNDAIAPNAGTYGATVIFTPADTSNYHTVSGTVNVAVAKATPVVTTWPSSTPITYGQALSSSTLEGAIISPVGTVAFTDPATVPDAGLYSASVVFTPTDTANYNTTSGNVNVTVNKANLAVTAVASTVTYGGTPTVTVEYTGFVAGDDASDLDDTGFALGSDYVQYGNVGTYNTTIGMGTASDGNYHFVPLNSSTFAVVARDITVTAGDKSKTYGDADPDLTYTVTSGSLVSTDHFTGALSRVAGANVGDYAILQGTLAISDGNSGNNYDLTYVPGTLTISPKPLTITAADADKIYGNTYTFDGTTEFSTSGMVGGDSVSSVTLSSPGTPASATVGSYTITASGALGTGLGNYDITYATGTLEVEQRPITVTAVPDTKTYDQTTGSSGTPVISSGTLAAGHTGSWSQAFDTRHAGSGKTLTPSGTISSGATDVTANYDITFSPVSTGQINARTLTLSGFTASNKTYDNSTSVSGTGFDDDRIAGDALSFSYTAAFADKNVGTGIAVNYSGISISGGADQNNYTLASSTGSTTANITTRPLSITADSKSKTYDGAIYGGGYSVSYSGFAPGEDASVLSGSVSYSGTAIAAINAGSYTITPSGQSSANYSISYSNGTLTIHKADPVVTTWPSATPIALGQALSASELSVGSATPAGSFGFTSPGTIPGSEGIYSASVTYTPTDTTNYNTASAGVSVDVRVLRYISISVTPGSREILLHFNLKVDRNANVLANLDFTVFVVRANGDEEVLQHSVTQPNGSADSFLVRVTEEEKIQAGDTVEVTINLSGAGKLEDLGGNTLDTAVLTRSASTYPILALNVPTAYDISPTGEAAYQVSLTNGVLYIFETTDRSGLDPMLYLYGDPDLTDQLAMDDDGGTGLEAKIEYAAPATGHYYIVVRAFDGGSTGTGTLTATGGPL